MKYPATPAERIATLLDAARVLAGNSGLHDLARDCASLTVKAIRQEEKQTERPKLTFDRFGVTGPDGERIATFRAATESNDPAKAYGALFAASPDMSNALETIAGDKPFADASGDTESMDKWIARQGEAGLRDHIDFLRDLARNALAFKA